MTLVRCGQGQQRWTEDTFSLFTSRLVSTAPCTMKNNLESAFNCYMTYYYCVCVLCNVIAGVGKSWQKLLLLLAVCRNDSAIEARLRCRCIGDV
jgi:hypothetical protein